MFLPAFALLPLIADIRDMHYFSFFLRALCVCVPLSLSHNHHNQEYKTDIVCFTLRSHIIVDEIYTWILTKLAEDILYLLLPLPAVRRSFILICLNKW